MITLHHLENSQSFRIIWLFEELEIPYELKTYARDKITSLAPKEYKDLHPAGTAPVISDGELTLAETNAIVDYVLDKHPESTLRPDASSPLRTSYLYWLHSAQGSFTPMLLMMFILHAMTDKTPSILRPLIKKVTNKTAQILPMPRLKLLLTHMNNELATAEFLAGDSLTAADIVMVYNLDAIEKRMGLFDFTKDYPNIAQYMKRLTERNAFKIAVEKSGSIS